MDYKTMEGKKETASTNEELEPKEQDEERVSHVDKQLKANDEETASVPDKDVHEEADTSDPEHRRYYILAGLLICWVVIVIAVTVAVAGGSTEGGATSDIARGQPENYGPRTPSGGDYGGDEDPGNNNGDQFDSQEQNGIQSTLDSPVSTFSADVDTASYSYTRRLIRSSGRLPSSDAVRAEEFINYFDYDYPQPQDQKVPFLPTVMLSDSPWNVGRQLLHIGIKGYDIDPAERPSSNIVFLIDVSGSMSSSDKLPLARKAIKLLVGTMDARDHVSIVTYASGTGVALRPTSVTEEGRSTIHSVLADLSSGGGTYGAGGIELAYELAEENFDEEAVNRIILLTDGDFNIGRSDTDSLKAMIEDKRDTGIFLSVLGFGTGNYHDTTMKALANHGNGVASYIDSVEEAHKVMVTEAFSTVFPIAKDVKFQIEFNPDKVSEYRLIGYEKRILDEEDFDDDKVDAGDIGSGHTVTAIYEIALVSSTETTAVDTKSQTLNDGTFASGEYAFLKIRYKLPDEDESTLLQEPITAMNEISQFEKNPLLSGAVPEFSFATAVAGFAQILKGGTYIDDDVYGLDSVLELAEPNLGEDPFGYRSGFINLVQEAQDLMV